MASKKGGKEITSGSQPALRIGSFVRCIDDGVEGRIVWANAVSVKIRWNDGEQVTWRRDSLAERPLEILEPVSEAEQADGKQTGPSESTQEEPATSPLSHELAASEPTPSTPEPTPEERLPPEHEARDSQTVPTRGDGMAKMPAAPKQLRKKPTTPKNNKLSALDAAAKVLAQVGRAMSCQEMIAAMAAEGYWSSPAGKTPQSTLYSAVAREITIKGPHSRFAKTVRGKFTLTNPV